MVVVFVDAVVVGMICMRRGVVVVLVVILVEAGVVVVLFCIPVGVVVVVLFGISVTTISSVVVCTALTVVVVLSGISVTTISSVVVCTALTSADVTVKFKFAETKAELTRTIGSGTTMDGVMGALALAGMGSVFLTTVMTTVP